MIVIERTVDLSKPISTETLRGNEFTGEARGHQFRISVVQDGEPVTLTGSISAKMLLANGDGLELSSLNSATALEDGVAVVTLVQACYGVPGRFHLGIYHTLTTSGVTDTTCIYSCVGSVVNATGDPEYSPGAPIGNLETLFEEAETASAEAASALAQATAVVSYAEQTTQTDAQKAQARTNIGAASAEDVGVSLLPWDGNGLIDLSVGVGNTVTMTPGSSNSTKYLVVDCSAGDKFTVFGYGGMSGRLYGFVDSNNVLLLAAGEQEGRDGYVVTAPAGSAKAIFHNGTFDEYTQKMIYKGVLITGNLPDMVSNALEKPVTLVWQNGGVDGTGLTVNSSNKRSMPIGFNPGERLIIDHARKDINCAVYALKDGVYSIVGQDGYTKGGAHYEFTDWTRSYRIRLAPYSGSTRPDPASGGYVSAKIVSDREVYKKNWFKTCDHPVIGYHRTYTNIKPFLTMQAKTISASGIADSSTDCLVTLPNYGWVEVKQDGQGIKFKVAKVTNGTVTFLVSDWSYYTYRFQGDGSSDYYALVELSDGAAAGSDIMVYAKKYLGVYLYTDEGMDFGTVGYSLTGKHIAFIGDSITQGRFDNNNDGSLDTTTSKPFGALVAEVAGDDDYGNFGIGGALVSGNEWKSLKTNCGKVSGYDVVFVCGGTNDYGNNVDGATFKSDYETVVDTLISNNSTGEVILCTPIYRTSKSGPNTQSLWLQDYAEKIREVAAARSLKVVDLMYLTANGCMTRFMPDGLHPDERGHRVIADRIISECDRLAGY